MTNNVKTNIPYDYLERDRLHDNMEKLLLELIEEHESNLKINSLVDKLLTRIVFVKDSKGEYIRAYNGTANITVSNNLEANHTIEIISGYTDGKYKYFMASPRVKLSLSGTCYISELLEGIYYELNKNNPNTFATWVKYFSSNIHPQNFMFMMSWANQWCRRQGIAEASGFDVNFANALEERGEMD